MSGRVFRRGPTWTYVVDVGTGPEGRRKQRMKGGFATKREAERALRELQRRLDEHVYVEPTKQTLAGFLQDEWLPAMRPPQLRATTWTEYQRKVNDHIVPRIGSLRLQELNPVHLNTLYATLLATGRKDGTGGLAPKTVRDVHVILRKALKDATRWGRCERNVAIMADPPPGRSTTAARRRAMRTWTAAEVQRFLAHVDGDPLSILWLLAVTTGMRRSELCGLRWADVDLDRGRLAVRQRLASVNGTPQLSEPKSHASGRTIDLDHRTCESLRAHYEAQAKLREQWGAAWQDHDLVITRGDGRWIHPDWITELFRRHAKAAGLPPIRLHDLRHTHATLLLRANVNAKVVSERLGHHSVAFTLDTYAHVMPGMQADAAQTLADAIFTPLEEGSK